MSKKSKQDEMPKLRKELPNIYSVTYDTQYELCMSFVRIEEFYESPSTKFRGKFFDLEDYMDYWSLRFGNGVFSYPANWHGFNVSGKVMSNWIKKFEDSLRSREETLIHDVILKKLSINDLEKSYIVGLYKEDDEFIETKYHELAHAMYATYPAYKTSCRKLLRSKSRNPIYKKAKKQLLSMGYGKPQLLDELQAYWSTSEISDDSYTLNGDPLFIDNFRIYYAKNKNRS